MTDDTVLPFSFPAIARRKITAAFDGGRITSDGGVMLLAAAERRVYNRRFLQMCGHYLVDPVACTPTSGWEKGQVENQVGLVRERFFTPRLRVKSYDELNALLLDKCVASAPQCRPRCRPRRSRIPCRLGKVVRHFQ